MSNYEAACELMQSQLGYNVELALATCCENEVSVRIVNGYYKDGAVYVVTHMSSKKMQQVLQNPKVSLCRNLFQGFGVGENLGSPMERKNRSLAKELREVFISFYDMHVDESDPGTCILKIIMTKAVVFSDHAKYIIDYPNETAEKFPYEDTMVYEA